MNRIDFRNSMLIGHPDIDAEHRELIDLINVCIDGLNTDAGRTAFVSTFERFYDALHDHVRHEEQIMEAYGFRETDQERRLHDDSLEVVGSLLEDAKGRVSLEGIVQQTVRMIVEVMLRADLPFKSYLQSLDDEPDPSPQNA